MKDAEGAPLDAVIVGGGVNGTGIARDAAGRGLNVLLCEQDDLASHTSSASTKLIHGGLRYLEQFHFALVRKALREREVLLASAPHIIWPLRFVLPHDSHLRPEWLIRAGLFLYDHLARRKTLERSRALDLTRDPAGAALQQRFTRGFSYADAWVEDSRLVALCAVDAAERGAQIRTRTRFVDAQRQGGLWRISLETTSARGGHGSPAPSGPHGDAQTIVLRARAIVNAAGPWVGHVHGRALRSQAPREVRLVKGSHIIVPRQFEHESAYIFQNPDRRIVFAIPFERAFTLIGTTDVDFHGDPALVSATGAEREYLCEMASRWLRKTIRITDVVHAYAGVRPLRDDDQTDPARTTRDYAVEVDESDGAPLVSIFGGKITTFRTLAEEATDALCRSLRESRLPWTRAAHLPGGDMPHGDFAAFLRESCARFRAVDPAVVRRWARSYGTRLERFTPTSAAEIGADVLGPEVLPGLHAAEIEYLRRHEFAMIANDILWRRSRLGLHLPRDAEGILDHWLT